MKIHQKLNDLIYWPTSKKQQQHLYGLFDTKCFLLSNGYRNTLYNSIKTVAIFVFLFFSLRFKGIEKKIFLLFVYSLSFLKVCLTPIKNNLKYVFFFIIFQFVFKIEYFVYPKLTFRFFSFYFVLKRNLFCLAPKCIKFAKWKVWSASQQRKKA